MLAYVRPDTKLQQRNDLCYVSVTQKSASPGGYLESVEKYAVIPLDFDIVVVFDLRVDTHICYHVHTILQIVHNFRNAGFEVVPSAI